jgi:hypothetical protein
MPLELTLTRSIVVALAVGVGVAVGLGVRVGLGVMDGVPLGERLELGVGLSVGLGVRLEFGETLGVGVEGEMGQATNTKAIPPTTKDARARCDRFMLFPFLKVMAPLYPNAA